MSGGGGGVDVIERRRALMVMQKNKPSVVNLCPAATGTEMRSWVSSSGSMRYTLTGLDPKSDYTIQVTITSIFERTPGRRLYLFADNSSGQYIDTSVESVPITKTFTRKPTANGELTISHNTNALNDDGYAAALTNIQLEIGPIAHPYVPYKG